MVTKKEKKEAVESKISKMNSNPCIHLCLVMITHRADSDERNIPLS